MPSAPSRRRVEPICRPGRDAISGSRLGRRAPDDAAFARDLELAAHRHVVAIGVTWSFAEIDLAVFAARAHDIPLSIVVTERGVV